MSEKRPGDRHSAPTAVLVRMSREERAELESAIQALRERHPVPGQKIALKGFILEVSLAAARKILAEKK